MASEADVWNAGANGGSGIGGGFSMPSSGWAGLAGGLLGGMAGTGPSTINGSSSSFTNPMTSPYLEDYLKRANVLSNDPNSTVAGFNPNQNKAFGMIENNANGGNPYLNASNQTLTDTASGKYLDGSANPYLQSSMDAAMGKVRGAMGSTFSGQNFGSSAHEEMLNRQGTQALAPIMMQNYQQERGNQLNAAHNANNYAYQGANNLLNVGNQQQNLDQQQLNDPYKKLGLLQSAVGTGMRAGGVTNTTQANPNQGNQLGNMLGGAASLAGLFM